MPQDTDNTKLGYLGYNFQLQLIKVFFEDSEFFTQLESIVDQNMFSDESLRRIVGNMKDYYNENDAVPSYGMMKMFVNSKMDQTSHSREEVIATIGRIQDEVKIENYTFIKDESEKFFKQQNLTKAIHKAEKIIKDGNASRYYEIEDLFERALEVNTKADYGFRIFDNIDEALQEDYRCAIPTGCAQIDSVLEGGIAKGELGVIIAPSGTGKTSSTTGFAANAAITKTKDNNYSGYKVLHLFFEDREVDIKRKYYGFVTDIEACDLSKPGMRENALRIINSDGGQIRNMIQNNVVAKRLISGEVSASEIKNFIKQLISRGFKPDLVIVDYFECLKLERGNTSGDSEWTMEGITMRKLESITKEFNVALWCPIQGSKESFGNEFVGMNQGGGSVKKVQIGHIIMSYARTDEMRRNGKINVFLHKFRGGRIDKGAIQGLTLNNGTCRFSFNEDEAFDNIDLD